MASTPHLQCGERGASPRRGSIILSTTPPMDRKEYLRIYQRKWIAARRKLFMHGRVCQRCGSSENMEIHHRDPGTKIEHRIWSWSIKRIIEELKKCDFLCRSCHWEETKKERKYLGQIHGTNTSYNAYKCRCQPCKTAHNMYCKKYKLGNTLRKRSSLAMSLQ